ncbi:flippase [Kiritimatiellota bacterium B12222]|nr:flippase [Kiritimatiellota bacterium B12222]
MPKNLTRESKHFGWNYLIRGSVGVGILKVMSMGISFFNVFLITKIFGLVALGLFGLSRTLIDLIMVFSKAGLPTLVLKEIGSEANPESKSLYFKAILKLSFQISIGASLLVVIFSYPLAHYVYKSPILTVGLVIGALVIPLLSQGSTIVSALNGIGSIYTAALLQLIVPNIFVLLAICLGWWYGFDHVLLPLLGLYVGWILSYFIGLCRLSKKLPLSKASGQEPILTSKELLKTAWPMALSNVSFFMLTMTDTLMLGVFQDMENVGIYRVLTRLTILCAFALPALNALTGPSLARLHRQEKHNELIQQMKRVRWIALAGAWVPFLILCFGNKRILLIFGTELVPYTLSLLLLALGQSIMASFGMATPFLNMTGYQHEAGRNSLVGACVNVIANFVLIPKLGLLGAAISTLLGITVWVVGANISMQRAHRFNFVTTWR